MQKCALIDWTVIRFILVGGINTLFGLIIIFTCKWIFGLDDVFSNLIGYSAGIVLSFTLNQRWTFRFTGTLLPALARFLFVFLISYLANLATVLIFIKIGVDSYLAQLMGVVPYTMLGYFGSRFFAFRDIQRISKISS
jgi:putative flippase GtrA